MSFRAHFDRAVREGRAHPAQREPFEALYEVAPEAVLRLLDSLPDRFTLAFDLAVRSGRVAPRLRGTYWTLYARNPDATLRLLACGAGGDQAGRLPLTDLLALAWR